MKTIAILLILMSLFRDHSAYAMDDFEKAYHVIAAKPQVKISLFNGRIEIVNIYKVQIRSIFESRNMAEGERIDRFVHDVFVPYQEFWQNFFDESGFRKWTKENWEKLQNAKSPGFLIPFEIDFDSLFTATVLKVKMLTSREPKGKWFLAYGNKASNIGGFYNEDMFVDFFGIGDHGVADLIFSLPHEINHQILSNSKADENTLLQTILDEGFACYINYLYWDKKFSPAKNIDFTEQEWQWCLEHEDTIFKCAKILLDSTNRDIIGKFQKAHRYILDGAPDRIAYFIGFRICETYVKMNGNDAWHNIYDAPAIDILRSSNYEKSTINHAP